MRQFPLDDVTTFSAHDGTKLAHHAFGDGTP